MDKYGISDTCRTWAEIDLDALIYNFRTVKKSGKKIMCVVKANAYGHGAVICANHLEKHGADAFAVACINEALELREGGITRPILILGYTESSCVELISKFNLTQSIVDEEYAIELDEQARQAGVKINTHIKIDTGMSRTGLFAQGEDNCIETIEAVKRIIKLENLNVNGMYMHFAAANMPDEKEYTDWQVENYMRVVDGLEKDGIVFDTYHMNNTAAIENYPQAKCDMVREGVVLYGMYPDNVIRKNGKFRPVMTLKARVAQVKNLPAGTTISYGRAFMAERDMRSAVITAGYADGIPRRLSSRLFVVINGEKYNQVGAICMDMLMVDVTGSDVKRGDMVTLFGGDGMTAEEVAKKTGTINYEITCLVTDRTKRVYLLNEE